MSIFFLIESSNFINACSPGTNRQITGRHGDELNKEGRQKYDQVAWVERKQKLTEMEPVGDGPKRPAIACKTVVAKEPHARQKY